MVLGSSTTFISSTSRQRHGHLSTFQECLSPLLEIAMCCLPMETRFTSSEVALETQGVTSTNTKWMRSCGALSKPRTVWRKIMIKINLRTRVPRPTHSSSNRGSKHHLVASVMQARSWRTAYTSSEDMMASSASMTSTISFFLSSGIPSSQNRPSLQISRVGLPTQSTQISPSSWIRLRNVRCLLTNYSWADAHTSLLCSRRRRCMRTPTSLAHASDLKRYATMYWLRSWLTSTPTNVKLHSTMWWSSSRLLTYLASSV